MELNKTTHLLTVPKLRVLVKWYSRDGDGKLPSEKEDLLQQYDATKHHGDRMPPMPPPPGEDCMSLLPLSPGENDMPPIRLPQNDDE
jgi:hypothetical protein